MGNTDKTIAVSQSELSEPLCGNAGITEEQYAAAIPKCCQMQTMPEHMDMMLCWGLAAALRRGETMNCDGCEMKIAA